MPRCNYVYPLACAVVGLVLLAAATVASSDVQPTTQPSEQVVTIDNFAFNPRVLTVKPGTTVTWLNRDDVPHTATSSEKPRKFNSKTLDTDEKFSRVFTTPGVYPYYCAIHPHMTAQIIVK